MDAPPSPLFRQVAVEAASGTQIGASLSTHWRGVPVFTAIAAVLLAALIAFVAVVEYAPVHRVAAFVDARAGPAAAGESVQGGPPAFAITPAREPLVVKFLIPSAAVSSVRPGVVVKLAFRDYPRERFGVFETKVESVDAVSSLPGAVAQAAASATAPMFLATASLPSGLHDAHGEALVLKPGMVADALIAGERGTLLAWLLDPGRHERSVGRPLAAAVR